MDFSGQGETGLGEEAEDLKFHLIIRHLARPSTYACSSSKDQGSKSGRLTACLNYPGIAANGERALRAQPLELEEASRGGLSTGASL